MNSLELIQNARLFKGINEDDARMLGELAQPREFAKGETIFSEGAPSDTFFLIESGDVELGTQAEDKWIPYYSLGAGYSVGIISFFGRTEHRTTAKARSATRTLSFDKTALPLLRRLSVLLLSIFERRTERLQKLVEIQEDTKVLSQQEVEDRLKGLRELLEELEDQSAALHNEIHRTQIKLKLYEATLANPK